MKLNVVLLVVGLLLFALGGEGVFQAVRHRHQSTLTCGQFLSQAPRERWLRVTGCAIDYISPGIVESGGTIQELYFPVRPAGEPLTSPAPLVAATRDPQALAIAQAIIGDYKQPDQEAFVVMMLQIVTTLKASREVEGYVRGGPIERRQSRRALSGLKSPLSPSFVVLDLHARPRVLVPAIEAGAGASMLLLYVITRRRRPRGAAADAVPEAPVESAIDAPLPQAVPDEADFTSPESISALAADADEPDVRDTLEALDNVPLTEAPPLVPSDCPGPTVVSPDILDARVAPAEPAVTDGLELALAAPEPADTPTEVAAVPVEFQDLDLPPAHATPAEPDRTPTADAPVPAPSVWPTMLLLNLPANAGLDAIEHAPPLGTRAEVIGRCLDAWPGLHIDEAGRATADDADGSLTLEIGTTEPVWTATVQVHGVRGGELALSLATRAGWRLFVPRRGVFFEGDRS